MLSLESVEVGYGPIKALKGVTMKVGDGQIVALLGANGAGKTTALRSISGLLRASGGRIAVDGARLDRLSPEEIVRRGVVHVPEGRRVFAGLTVLENLRMGAYCRSGDIADDLQRVYKYFPILDQRRKQAGGSLSGGEQQMLAIGRALMTNPDLLVLDEATEGLAPLVRREIWAVIRRLKAAGIAALIVDKDIAALSGIADRCVIIAKGRIVYSGTPAALAADREAMIRHLGV